MADAGADYPPPSGDISARDAGADPVARVRLRPYSAGFSESELRALYRWALDEEIQRLSGGRPLELPYPRFKELFLVQLPRHNTVHEQLFAVMDEQDEMIGRGGLFRIDRAAHRAELGLVIGERSRWGKGYGREAVRGLCRFAASELALRRVLLYTYPDNHRAQRAFSAAGFRPVRELRRFSFDRGTHWELEMAIDVAGDKPAPSSALGDAAGGDREDGPWTS
jgi:RimJ/RimL family protein N-acetyltransferase